MDRGRHIAAVVYPKQEIKKHFHGITKNKVRRSIVLGNTKTLWDAVSSLHWSFSCFLCHFCASGVCFNYTSSFLLSHRCLFVLFKKKEGTQHIGSAFLIAQGRLNHVRRIVKIPMVSFSSHPRVVKSWIDLPIYQILRSEVHGLILWAMNDKF